MNSDRTGGERRWYWHGIWFATGVAFLGIYTELAPKCPHSTSSFKLVCYGLSRRLMILGVDILHP